MRFFRLPYDSIRFKGVGLYSSPMTALKQPGNQPDVDVDIFPVCRYIVFDTTTLEKRIQYTNKKIALEIPHVDIFPIENC